MQVVLYLHGFSYALYLKWWMSFPWSVVLGQQLQETVSEQGNTVYGGFLASLDDFSSTARIGEASSIIFSITIWAIALFRRLFDSFML